MRISEGFATAQVKNLDFDRGDRVVREGKGSRIGP
ncbi:hypothetical protein NDX98_24285 [Enterobacter roggenkampii]